MESFSTDSAGFSKALMALCDQADGSIEKVIRKACIDLYSSIVKRTPHDTRRAQVNWNIDTRPTEGVSEERECSAGELQAIIRENTTEFTFDIHDNAVYITNNLEYIEKLESGTSEQAPTGMVMVSLVEFETHFNNELQGIEGLEPT